MPTLATYTMCVWGKRPTFGFSGTDNVQGEMSWGTYSEGEYVQGNVIHSCQLLRMVTIEIAISYTQEHMRVAVSCRYSLSRLGRCF